MREFITQYWHRLRGTAPVIAMDAHQRLLVSLDDLVEQCDTMPDIETAGLPLLSDRYYALVRAAREGHYPIQSERIAECLLEQAA